MAELNPISPNPVVRGVKKIEDEQKQNRERSKRQPKDERSAPDQSRQTDQPAKHIDEVV